MTSELDRFPGIADDLLEASSEFQRCLLAWFSAHARRLPWRETKDPYLIWLSEVILQQTRVDQAIPYFYRLTEAFPTVEALASASLDDVLLKWEGLGYYSRARNLHRAANIIVKQFDGRIPDEYEVIRTLPGIGPYTAAAVLSIAYGRPHAVLDGNVIRVLSRLLAFEDDVRRTGSKRFLQDLAGDLLDERMPGAFNEAMMELGATVCLPRNPICSSCPVQSFCRASGSDPQSYPKRSRRPPVPHYEIAVGVLLNRLGELYAQRRLEEGLLGGLWEFPGGKREQGESIEETCRRELLEELGIDVEVGELLSTVRHAYSHFKITLYAFKCTIIAGTPESTHSLPTAWIAADRLEEYAFPRANRKLIERLVECEEISL